MVVKSKTCYRCRETKPESEFYPGRNRCRPCGNAVRTEFEADRERRLAQDLIELKARIEAETEARWQQAVERYRTSDVGDG